MGLPKVRTKFKVRSRKAVKRAEAEGEAETKPEDAKPGK